MLPHWTEGYVNVGLARFHYTRTGDGSKPALVLAHGFSDNGLCWSALAQQLEADWDVIMPDARGHGLSQRVAAGEAVDLPADLAGIIAALKLNQPVVGGHSMGGYTAAGLGARFPQAARALILEDPAWFDPEQVAEEPQPSEAPADPYEGWRSGLGGDTVDELIAKCHADNPTWRDEEMQNWAQSKFQMDPNFLRGSSMGRMHEDWRDTAKAITAPTLLITADPAKGSIVTAESAQLATELCPSLEVAHIPNVGHCIRREAPEAYLEAVKTFLARFL